MPTLVDSLILELRLDPAQFTTAQKEAGNALQKTKEQSVAAATEIERQGQRAANFFKELRGAVIALYATFTAGRGLRDLADQMTDVENRTGLLSRAFGITVQALGTWGGAATLMGGSVSAVQGDLAMLSTEMNTFEMTGNSKLLGPLRYLKVGFKDANGEMKDAATLLTDIRTAVEKLHMPAAAQTAFYKQLGLGMDTINILELTNDKFKEYMDLAKSLAPTKADTDAAAARTFAWGEFQLTLDKLTRTVLIDATPALIALANAMTEVAKWLTENHKAADALVVAIGALSGLATITAAFWLLSTAAGAAATAIGGIGTAITGLSRLIPLLGPVAAFVATMWPKGTNEDEQATLDRLRPNRSRGADGWGGTIVPEPGAAVTKPGTSGGLTPGMIARIRSSFAAAGIDPDIAVQVAKRESGKSLVGDQGSSFGPFQLHYGNMPGATGGNRAPGLGDEFTKATGLHASDIAGTVNQQIDWYAKYVAAHGWAKSHAWNGTPWAGIGTSGISGADAQRAALGGGGAGSSTSNEVHIGSITVHTQARDANGIANDLGDAIRRNMMSSPMNRGQQ